MVCCWAIGTCICVTTLLPYTHRDLILTTSQESHLAMAVSCAAFVLTSDENTVGDTAGTKCTVKRGQLTCSVDGMARTPEAMWALIKPILQENIHEGVNTSIVVCGGSEWNNVFFNTVLSIEEVTMPSDSMKLLDIALSATVSCCEFSNEKVRDVLTKDSLLQDRKIRGGKVEGAVELPLVSQAVKERLSHPPSHDGSTYIANIAARWANGIVARHSHIQLVALPTSSRNAPSADKARPTPYAAFVQVIDALLKKKKGFVPYRTTATTQIMAEYLESSKVIFVACVGGREDPDAVATLKLASKCRDVVTSLRSMEEYVDDHEGKNVLFSLRRKVADIGSDLEAVRKQSEAQHQAAALSAADSLAEQQLERLQKEKAASITLRRLSETKTYLAEYLMQVAKAEGSLANTEKCQGEYQELESQCAILMEDIEDESHFNFTANEDFEDAKQLEEELRAQRRLQEVRGNEAMAGRSALQARSLANTFRAAHKIGLEQSTAKRNADKIDILRNNLSKTESAILQIDEDLDSARKWHLEMKEIAEQATRQEDAMTTRLSGIRADISAIIQGIESFTQELESHSVEKIDDILDYREGAKRQAAADELRTAELASQVSSIRIAAPSEYRRKLVFDKVYSHDALCAFALAEEATLKHNNEACDALRDEVYALRGNATLRSVREVGEELGEKLLYLERLRREHECLSRNFMDLRHFIQRREKHSVPE